MNYDACKERVESFFQGKDNKPCILDVPCSKDLEKFRLECCVGNRKIIKASQYCIKDGFPKFDELLQELKKQEGDFFVIGFSAFLRLEGEERLRNWLRKILDFYPLGHVLFVTLNCRHFLPHNDPRLDRRMIIMDGAADSEPDVCFCAPDLPLPPNAKSVIGLSALADSLEKGQECQRLYVVTRWKKDECPRSLLPIKQLNSAYDMLAERDYLTRQLNKSMGTEQEWTYALSLFDNTNDWADLIDHEFGDHKRLDTYIPGLSQWTSNKKWLYFIGLKLYGAPTNWCLNDSAENAVSVSDMRRRIFFGILGKSPKDSDFWECYRSRKELLKQMGSPIAELDEFCRVVMAKGKDAIFYLTDNTKLEKERVFGYLDQYGDGMELDELERVLARVYPDLSYYLSNYRFNNELLDSYFTDYKYQKVINKLFPAFYVKVMEQAVKRDYNALLSPRSTLVEQLPHSNANLYFMDAMGVEYLGYIQKVCHDLGLHIRVTVCRCELPSITSKNKEFLEGWDDKQIVSIKDIDEIKHHGKYDFDYHKNKLPIHLIEELNVIHDVLKKINADLVNGKIRTAIMIADHGASRLCVLYENAKIWEMSGKGEHSGRCCKKNETDKRPAFAVDADDYWSLANYDRFKGGRKAQVEVHGGATLEEVCVPIIELTVADRQAEVYLMPVGSYLKTITETPEIQVSFRKKAAIDIFITIDVTTISVQINGKTYQASRKKENNYFTVQMPDIKKPGKYLVDVYADGELVKEGLPLLVKREGQQVIDLL